MRTILCILLCAVSVGAASWSDKGTKISTNAIYAAADPGRSVNFVQAKGYNNGTLTLTIYDATAGATITNALAANVGSNLLASLTPGDFVPGDGILVRDLSAGTYQRAWVHSTNASGMVITNIYVTGAAGALSTQTIAAGDKIYNLTSMWSETIANNTVHRVSGQAVWRSPDAGTGYPSLFEVTCDQTTLLTNLWLSVTGE